MSQVHGSYLYGHWCLFQKGIKAFRCSPDLKKKYCILGNTRSVYFELDPSSDPLFYKLYPEAAQIPQVHHIDVFLSKEPVRLYHKCFGNNVRINLIGLVLRMLFLCIVNVWIGLMTQTWKRLETRNSTRLSP